MEWNGSEYDLWSGNGIFIPMLRLYRNEMKWWLFSSFISVLHFFFKRLSRRDSTIFGPTKFLGLAGPEYNWSWTCGSDWLYHIFIILYCVNLYSSFHHFYNVIITLKIVRTPLEMVVVITKHASGNDPFLWSSNQACSCCI